MTVVLLEEASSPHRKSRRGRRLILWSSGVVVSLAVVVALLGPLLAPHDPNTADLQYAYVGPIPGHPLGFDGQGRDLLSRLLVGARTALVGPLIAVLAAMVVGSLLALAAAWRGGWLDSIVTTALDIVFGFPAILLAILAAAVFGAGLIAPTVAIAVAYTPYVARILRGEALRERNKDYVAVCQIQGQSVQDIWLRHLVPNLAPIMVAQGTLIFGYAIVDLAAISYLGLGVNPPQADWGVMVASGQAGLLQGYPMESLTAGACLVLVVVAVNLLGDRLATTEGA